MPGIRTDADAGRSVRNVGADMATYVTSDAHGHLRALDRALESISLGAHDELYVLGDMVDRGPDPVGVLRLVHGLPGAHVLMGNHESMLLNTLSTGDQVDMLTWEMNGGYTTASGLDACSRVEYVELLHWIESLPLYDTVEVGGRTYLLVHAGFDALALRGYLATAGYAPQDGYARVPDAVWRDALSAQDPEDLLWIRGAFWGAPTGLVDARGEGPVAIAGHTPTVLLGQYAELMGGPVLDGDDRARMVEVGACWDTFGVADRIDIDCSAAAGAPHCRVGVMRLYDRKVFYAEIGEGE